MFDSYRRFLNPDPILDIVEPEILRQLMDGFYYKQQAGMLLSYASPDPLPAGRRFHRLEPVPGDRPFENARFNPFCARFRNSLPERDQMCEDCDDRHAQQVVDNPTAKVCYTCHMGLYDFRYPISVGQKVLAVFLAGQRVDKSKKWMLDRIDRQVDLKAPELKIQLRTDLEECGQSPEEVTTAEESFRLFGEVVQRTVGALYAAKLQAAMFAAVVEANEYLAQNMESCTENWGKPVDTVLNEISSLFNDQPLILLVRRKSRYQALAVSTAAEASRETTIPVVECIHLARGEWHSVKAGDRLHERFRGHLRIASTGPIHLFSVTTPGTNAAGLSVLLCSPWNIPQDAREFLEECTRAMAHPVNTALLFEQMSQQQEQFALSVAHTGHQLKTPIQSALFSAYQLEQVAMRGTVTCESVRR